MKCMFVADDGREFDAEEKCVAYEAKKKAEAEARERRLRELEEENKKKRDEKQRRYDEVDAAWKKYNELCKKYYEDYKDDEWLNPKHEDESDEPLSAEDVIGDLFSFIFS